jgi:hypothetical protein
MSVQFYRWRVVCPCDFDETPLGIPRFVHRLFLKWRGGRRGINPATATERNKGSEIRVQNHGKHACIRYCGYTVLRRRERRTYRFNFLPWRRRPNCSRGNSGDVELLEVYGGFDCSQSLKVPNGLIHGIHFLFNFLTN